MWYKDVSALHFIKCKNHAKWRLLLLLITIRLSAASRSGPGRCPDAWLVAVGLSLYRKKEAIVVSP